MLPQAVVVYRDGVSESEYEKVEQEEIKPIEGWCSSSLYIIRASCIALYRTLPEEIRK